MEFFLGVAPLGLVVILAVWLVWRGLRRPADSSKNRAGGGGPWFGGKGSRW